MTNPPAISPEAAVITYQVATAPRLRHPAIASIGFTLFAASPLLSLGLLLLRMERIVPFVGYAPGFILVRALLVGGALLVVYAFRQSSVVTSRLGIVMLATLWMHAGISAVYMFLGTNNSWWRFMPSSRLPLTLLYSLGFAQEISLAAVMLLWLIFLWRVGLAVDSIAFCIVSSLVLAVRFFLTLFWSWHDGAMILDALGLFPMSSGFQMSVIFSLRYADFVVSPLMTALSIWCILLTRPLARPPAPLTASILPDKPDASAPPTL